MKHFKQAGNAARSCLVPHSNIVNGENTCLDAPTQCGSPVNGTVNQRSRSPAGVKRATAFVCFFLNVICVGSLIYCELNVINY